MPKQRKGETREAFNARMRERAHGGPPCKYPDCGRPLGGRPIELGLCNSHYQMHRRGEPLRAIRGTQRTAAQKVIDVKEQRQTCTSCGERKPFDSFQWFMKRGQVCHVRRCKVCISTSPAIKIARRDRKYSLRPGEWERMFEEQGHACKICRGTEPGHVNGWVTDHDHSCCPGQGSCGACVRGILCHWCNINLSWYERLTDAIEGYVVVPQSMPYEVAL